MPLTSWHAEAAAAATDWNDVDYSPALGLYVSCARNGKKIMSSPDGITWTTRTPGSQELLVSTRWGATPAIFLIGCNPQVLGNIMHSVDGITWVTSASQICLGNTVEQIGYNSVAGRFLAVGGSTGISISTDGLTWTNLTLSNPTVNELVEAVWDSTHSVWVIADNVTTIWYSSDPPTGSSWTKVVVNQIVPGGLIFGNGKLVMVGQVTVSNARCQVSSDGGSTWSLETSLDTSVTWNSVAYDPDNMLFVAVGGGGTTANEIATSPDGITWTPQTAPNALDYTAVAYGNKLAVAVSTSASAADAVIISAGGGGGGSSKLFGQGFKWWW